MLYRRLDKSDERAAHSHILTQRAHNKLISYIVILKMHGVFEIEIVVPYSRAVEGYYGRVGGTRRSHSVFDVIEFYKER